MIHSTVEPTKAGVTMIELRMSGSGVGASPSDIAPQPLKFVLELEFDPKSSSLLPVLPHGGLWDVTLSLIHPGCVCEGIAVEQNSADWFTTDQGDITASLNGVTCTIRLGTDHRTAQIILKNENTMVDKNAVIGFTAKISCTSTKGNAEISTKYSVDPQVVLPPRRDPQS
jgi:hypothetical protein